MPMFAPLEITHLRIAFSSSRFEVPSPDKYGGPHKVADHPQRQLLPNLIKRLARATQSRSLRYFVLVINEEVEFAEEINWSAGGEEERATSIPLELAEMIFTQDKSPWPGAYFYRQM